jgi:hypothetical protein
VVSAYMRFYGSGGEPATIRTTFAVERIREATYAQFDTGVEVRDDTGTVLGNVADVTVRRSPEQVSDSEGRLHLRDSPLFYDVHIIVEGTGFASSSLIRVGSVPLRVGKVLVITGPSFEVRAAIRNVEVVG